MKTVAYGAINKNDEIRSISSSGAAFYEIAKWVLEQGGVVFGACFNAEWSVYHNYTENIEDLHAFLGSKYVQSSVNESYTLVKEFLGEGRLVLFAGTPCQVQGLCSFLNQPSNKLILLDIICHGSPSPLVWKKYLKEISAGRTVKEICFRDKTEGWRRFSLKIGFKDGSVYRKTQQEDLYMKGFLRDIYLRPSCYQCCFKGLERQADFTLADYWGVQDTDPAMYDDNGTSMVLIHSEAGKKIWETLFNEFKISNIQLSEVGRLNSAAIKSVERPYKKQKQFYKSRMDLKTLQKITQVSMLQRAVRKTKRIVKR